MIEEALQEDREAQEKERMLQINEMKRLEK